MLSHGTWPQGSVERELASEWAIPLTYINRESEDLPQDFDLNHITCEGFDETFGMSPMDVCGDGGRLELDRFGQLDFGFLGVRSFPNGAPDLYNLNPFSNQVLRVGNFNRSRHAATELTLRKRLHRNWQMMASYTYSKARGGAESFSSLQGNDPAVSDKVAGFLDYDQRHVLKWQVVTHLPKGLILGSAIEWASGLPWTLVSNVEDLDDAGHLTPQRLFSVTGVKNDQRNNSQITFNARVEKRLTMGRVQVGAFLEGENLFNTDDLVLRSVDIEARTTLDGYRRFGRRWQIGAAVHF